jgi:hypothetical protein
LANNDILIFPDDEQWGDFPPDFLDSEDGDTIINDLKLIRAAVGSPLQPLVSDLKTITEKGLAPSIRGIRFSSGAQALVWLFHRGIFLFSNIVQMGDGTWGVSIRNSDPVDWGDVEEGEDDIVF